MCYKDKVQKDNEIKLQLRFDRDGVSPFIRKYFINIESKSGAINYWIAIRDLLVWLMEKDVIQKSYIAEIQPDDFYAVESEDITLYLKDKEAGGMSPTTLETRKNIFSSFWRYLKRSKVCPVKENIIVDVTYRGITSRCVLKKFPTDSEIEMMENNIKRKKDSFVRERNLIVLRVLKGTGVRESELAGLDLKDLSLDVDMPYIKVLGKGSYREVETRVVYLTGDATLALEEWLKIRESVNNVIDESAVFLNKNGKRLTEKNIKAIFANYGNGITPHMMRHYYATVMDNMGNHVFTQQQLGHKNYNTTGNLYVNGCYGMENTLATM